MSKINLLRLEFENILSFKDAQEVLFTAETKYNGSPNNYIKREKAIGENLITPTTAIYGANASGKSNFIEIFNIIGSFLGNTYSKYYMGHYNPFLLANETENAPSKVSIDFCIDDFRYVLDFSFNREGIIAEELTEYQSEDKKNIYTRKNENITKIDKTLVSKFDIAYVKDTISKRNDLLVLDILDTRGVEYFHNIFRGLKTLTAHHSKENEKNEFFTTFAKQLYENAELKKKFVEFIKYADLGIIDVDVKPQYNMMPYVNERPSMFIGTDSPQNNSNGYEQFTTPYRPIEKEIIKDENGNEKYYVDFIHKGVNGKQELLLIERESLGTVQFARLLMKFIPALLNGGVFIIDEIENNLHPMVLAKIIEMFNTPEINIGGAQLIFSTHNTSILKNDVLQRDEIWFVEKNEEGCSEIYPLTDFNAIRKGFNYEKGYWEGRFGAIPYLDDIAELVKALSDKDEKND